MIISSSTNEATQKRRSSHDSISDLLAGDLPQDVESEQALLGCLILDPQRLDDLASLQASHFYDDRHRTLFAALRALHDDGKTIDLTLLLAHLRSTGKYEAIGASYVAELSRTLAKPEHAEHYEQLVIEPAQRRQVIESASEAIAAAHSKATTTSRIWNVLTDRAAEESEQAPNDTLKSLGDACHLSLDRLDKRLKGESTGSVLTGFNGLDDLTGGLHPNELAILAARPSMGKTAFALNIAANVAQAGNAVLFASLEMSVVELADRLLCSHARVNNMRLRNGTLSERERVQIAKHANQLSNLQLWINDAPTASVSQIAASARRINRNAQLDLIVIDYLQLIEPDEPDRPRHEQVAKMARRLKQLARQMSVPVLCLSQLNRMSADGKDHRPRLSHLRESGAIEQDADLVMFVHREEYFRQGEDKTDCAGQAEIIIAKQRNGPIGDVELSWEADFALFTDRASGRHAEFDDYSDEVDPPW